jgi:hypothetical protein
MDYVVLEDYQGRDPTIAELCVTGKSLAGKMAQHDKNKRQEQRHHRHQQQEHSKLQQEQKLQQQQQEQQEWQMKPHMQLKEQDQFKHKRENKIVIPRHETDDMGPSKGFDDDSRPHSSSSPALMEKPEPPQRGVNGSPADPAEHSSRTNSASIMMWKPYLVPQGEPANTSSRGMGVKIPRSKPICSPKSAPTHGKNVSDIQRLHDNANRNRHSSEINNRQEVTSRESPRNTEPMTIELREPANCPELAAVDLRHRKVSEKKGQRKVSSRTGCHRNLLNVALQSPAVSMPSRGATAAPQGFQIKNFRYGLGLVGSQPSVTSLPNHLVLEENFRSARYEVTKTSRMRTNAMEQSPDFRLPWWGLPSRGSTPGRDLAEGLQDDVKAADGGAGLVEGVDKALGGHTHDTTG